jgi:hypothetical protein
VIHLLVLDALGDWRPQCTEEPPGEFPSVLGESTRSLRRVTCERCRAKHFLGEKLYAKTGVTDTALFGFALLVGTER